METKESETSSLKVVIRVRGLNSKEIAADRQNAWNIDTTNGCLSQFINGSQTGKKYVFDRVYSPLNTTKDIYKESMASVIRSFCAGFNGTVFAYGQTSSGKTFTMMGSQSPNDANTQNQRGIIHRAISDIFKIIQKSTNMEFSLKCQYLEIYNETIKDLLSDTKNDNLKISMDNFNRPTVRGLTSIQIQNVESILNALSHGMSNRNIGATKMNDQSSRSHTIFQLTLDSRQKCQNPELAMDASVRSSILNIVDLAGSERAKKTDATGIRLKEGCNINQSLLTLGIVIKKLSEKCKNGKSDHIPYRDSKLTHILEPALGGNSKTVVICTMTSADNHASESISTLQFASRAKEVKNCAVINAINDDATVIRNLQKHIQALQNQMYQQSNNVNESGINAQNALTNDEKEQYEKKIARLEQMCKNIHHHSNNNEEMCVDDSDEKQRKSMKKSSILGKRRRHSLAIEINGSPARKRFKSQLMAKMPRNRCNSFSTPITKIQTEKDAMEWKLRKQTHITKGLQVELNSKYKDFHAMQTEIDRISKENEVYKQRILYFESSMNENGNDQMRENERLNCQINEMKQSMKRMNEELRQYKEENVCVETEKKLREELSSSQVTISQLNKQIFELRLNIEQQQKITETMNARKISDICTESASDLKNNNNEVLLLNLNKLRSKLILIKNDKMCIQQMLQNQHQKFISFKNECLQQTQIYHKQMNNLQNALDEANDNNNLLQSQCIQLREHRDEMHTELQTLRRPENEILKELEEQLNNAQKQSDIDMNHVFNTNSEIEDKKREIEHLKEIKKEFEASVIEREQQMTNDYCAQIKDLKDEIASLKQINYKIESDLNPKNINFSKSKIEQMNNSQLKDALKCAKKSMHCVQAKLSSIERKKDLNEKTAAKYTKKCSDLEQRFKKISRENSCIKSELMSTKKLNKRLNAKNEKVLRDVKKLQNDIVNSKELSRKFNHCQKKLESLHKKYEKLGAENKSLKEEKASNCKEIDHLKNNLNELNQAKNKLDENVHNLENELNTLQEQNNENLVELKTREEVVNGFKNELMKYHQINGEQSENLKVAKESNSRFEQEVNALNEKLSGLMAKIEELNASNNEYMQKQKTLQSKNESLAESLSLMKQSDATQKSEIDELNKMLREIQIELKENKKERSEYQNRWQRESKQNDVNIQKLRAFELKINDLLHRNQMNKTTINSKTKEIDRLNEEFKEQQQNLLKAISECAEAKSELQSFHNSMNAQKQENGQLVKEKERLQNILDEKEKLINSMKSEYNAQSEAHKNKMSVYQKQIKEIETSTNEKICTLQQNKLDLESQLNDIENSMKNQTQKNMELQSKFDALKTTKQQIAQELDEKEREVLDLEAQIEDVYIEKEKEAKDLQYRLKKKTNDFIEVDNALCELQKEYECKLTEIEENECLRNEKDRIYQRIESERNKLQIECTEMSKKCAESEHMLKSKHKELFEAKDALTNTLNKLQQITLQNEALKDDLNTISNENNGVIEKKYLKAKQIIKEERMQKQEIRQQFKESIERKKEREQRYENAIAQWKQHSEELKEKIAVQAEELKNLRPTKSKSRKFEQLCKEYHKAKINAFKKSCICRETQTYECRLDNNKENIHYTMRDQAI